MTDLFFFITLRLTKFVINNNKLNTDNRGVIHIQPDVLTLWKRAVGQLSSFIFIISYIIGNIFNLKGQYKVTITFFLVNVASACCMASSDFHFIAADLLK